MAHFRKFVLTSGRVIFDGRDAKNNVELVLMARQKDVLLHTAEPGSPFVNLGENPSMKDSKEGAIFCARYSQDWRDNKRDVLVNKFLRKDMSKSSKMKAGTWSVKKQERIRVKKTDILKLTESKVHCK